MRAPLPLHEARRLEVLRSLDVLDTAPEAMFDALTIAAQSVADAEFALVSIVDGDRQWFKSKVGLDAQQTHRDDAFCAHAILQSDVFCIDDATLDARFADNRLVTGALGLRAYAGAPITVDGQNIGTVCALSTTPRGFDAEVREQLARLAKAATECLEARRKAALRQTIAASSGEAVMVIDLQRRVLEWSPAAEVVLRVGPAEAIGRDVLSWIPADQRARRAAGLARLFRRAAFPDVGRGANLQVINSSGVETRARLTVRPWLNSGGELLGATLRLRPLASAGVIVRRDETFDLGRLFEDVLESYRRPAERRGLSYDLIAPPPETWVCADPRHLAQILSCLANNAVAFTKAGAIRIEATRVDEAGWRFVVADTGCGFAQAVAPRLFDRRGGLGLPIARDLARVMGGDLTATGQVGRGAEFRLTLPLSRA